MFTQCRPHRARTRSLVPPLVFAAALCPAVPVLAGPPLLTDDPETLPKGKFELNTTYRLTGSGRDGSAGRTWENEAPLFDLAYGLAEGVQIKLEAPLLIVDAAGDEPSHGGVGDASVGSKIRFTKEEEWPVSISIYPAVGIPLGDRSDGLGTGSPSLVFPLQVGHHFLSDRLWVYADGGYEEQLANGEPDTWFAGLAAEYEAAESLTLVGEVRREFGARSAPDDALFNVGLKWKLAEHASFIGAIGRSFNPSAETGADVRLNIGVQWTF